MLLRSQLHTEHVIQLQLGNANIHVQLNKRRKPWL